MGYPRDDDESFPVGDGVHDAVVADADSEVVTTGKLDGAGRSWVDRQAIDRRDDAVGN